MSKRLHIVAFDVPYPPNYGGICDVFYKLKSLHEAGAEIIYHCFYYKGHNPPTDDLKKYCHELHFYERKQSVFKLLFNKRPYNVASRDDTTLLMNLLADPDTPILFDGIQCILPLEHIDIQTRFILYRANNIEHEYYQGLVAVEKNPLKKIYLKMEARKLRNYEHWIEHSNVTLCVAKQDIPHFEQYGRTIHLPPFFDDTHTLDLSFPQPEKFVLFQANLSVKENENAAIHIIKRVAPLTNYKIKIAGRNPSTTLKKIAATQINVELIDSPEQEVMSDLIQQAQVHLLITFQQTGIKLKLLHALQSGRHIIINNYMDDDGIFSDMCDVVDRFEDMAKRIDELMDIEFTRELKDQRDKKFNAIYSNKLKAEKILENI